MRDHAAFEVRGEGLVALAAEAAEADAADARRLAHLLYLDLASFTSSYLAHQDLEERVIMPAARGGHRLRGGARRAPADRRLDPARR